MQYSEKMLELESKLTELGHDVFVSKFAKGMVGKTDEEKEELKLHQKYELDAIREYWSLLQDSDAILVANYDKAGIEHYIGGNAFLEMGFAYVLNRKIFLLNPIPKMPFYETELIAMRPVVIDGDLTKII